MSKQNTGPSMPWEQRRAELLKGLRSTVVEVVHQSVGHVAEVIGGEKAQELCQFYNEIKQATKPRKPRSAIPDNVRIQVNSIGRFVREELLKAIEEQTEDPHIKSEVEGETQEETQEEVEEETDKAPTSSWLKSQEAQSNEDAEQ
jgi:hypothetical protein